MSQYGSWSVKGIDDRARAAAKEQARLKGVTLGDYINDLLLAEQNAASADDTYDMLAEAGMSGKFEDLDQRLQASESRQTQTFLEMEQVVRGLIDRMEKSEEEAATENRNSRDVLADFAQSLQGVEARIDNISTDTQVMPDTGSLRAFEQAISKLAAHVHDKDKQVNGLVQATGHKMETALGALAGRLNDLEDKISEVAGNRGTENEHVTLAASVTSGLKAMDQAVSQIRERMDRAERTLDAGLEVSEQKFADIEALAGRHDLQKSQHIEDLFERFAANIDMRVEQKIAETTAGHDVASDQSLNRTVESLEQRLSANIEQSGQALEKLGNRIDQIGNELGAASGKAGVQEDLLHSTISAEITRFAEKFSKQMHDRERQGVDIMNEVSTHVSKAIKNVQNHQKVIQDTLKDQLAEAEKRQEARLSEVLNNISDRLSAMHDETVSALSPVREDIAALTTRLETLEEAPAGDKQVHAFTDTDEVASASPPSVTEDETAPAPDDSPAQTASDFDFVSSLQDFDDSESDSNESEPDTVTQNDLADNFTVPGEDAFDQDSVADHSGDAPEDEESEHDSGISQLPPDFGDFVDADNPAPDLQPTGQSVLSPVNRPVVSLDYLERARQAAIAASPSASKQSRLGMRPVAEKKRLLGKLSLFGGVCVLAAVATMAWTTLESGNDASPVAIVTAMAETTDTMPISTPDPSASPVPVSAADPVEDTPDVQNVPTPAKVAIDAQLAGNAGAGSPTPSGMAFATLEDAALAGNRIAQFRWGEMRLAVRDYNAGSDFVRRAARQDLPAAQYRLAKLYEEGLGVPRDLSEARFWAEKAARGGNVKAMHDLGVFYADGNGGLQSYAAAAEWFRKAADFGLVDSQYNLAVMYENGLGISQSQSEALYWYQIATANGDTAAAANIETLSANLPPEQVEQALERTLVWVATRPIEEANGNFGPQIWEGQALVEPVNAPLAG